MQAPGVLAWRNAKTAGFWIKSGFSADTTGVNSYQIDSVCDASHLLIPPLSIRGCAQNWLYTLQVEQDISGVEHCSERVEGRNENRGRETISSDSDRPAVEIGLVQCLLVISPNQTSSKRGVYGSVSLRR